jgi:hypothetical protein
MSASMRTRATGDPQHHEQGRPRRSPTKVRGLRPERFLFEPLERRTLFTVSIAGIQTIDGLRVANVTTTGNNTFTITHDGSNGNLVVAGATRLDVDKLVLRAGGGVDTITYNLTTNLQQDFILDADLGDGGDTFTANLNNDITAHHTLSIKVEGSGGGDSEIINADRDNNTDGFRVGGAGNCRIDLYGGAGSDFVRENYQGDLDGSFGGFIFLDRFTDTGADIADVTAVIDAGSTGSYARHIEGGLTDDNISFRIADNQGGRISSADVDAGFNFGDNDTVNHTRNVSVTNAEHDNIVSAPAFLNRTVTSPTARGTATKISGIITEPDAGDTFFLDVDWGDGTPKETFTYLPGSFVSGQTVATVEHTYDHVGKYQIRLTWRDQTGLSNDDNTLEAKVLPHAHKKDLFDV